MTEILKDVLIETGEIDRFYGDTAPVNLWRARNLQKKGERLFEIVEEEIIRPGGVRPADVTIEDGIVKVRNQPRGVSLFDKPDLFKRGRWEYYKLAKGTKLPAGLVIVKDKFNKAIGVTHYTIAPAHDMPIETFRSLLNILAVKLQRGAA
jgi:hypothetical protein